MEQGRDRGTRDRVSHRAVDAIVAAVFFVVGAVMIWDNLRLGAGWAPDGPQAGYFPLRIGVIICLCSAFILAQHAISKERPTHAFVKWERLKPVLLVLGPTALFILAIQLAGIYIAAALFIAGFMRFMGRYSWAKTLAVSLGVAAILFWTFEIQFMVPLPKGPLDALFTY